MPLQLFHSFNEEDDLLESSVNVLFGGKSALSFSKAHQERHWPLNLRTIQQELTGIDLDEEVLTDRLPI